MKVSSLELATTLSLLLAPSLLDARPTAAPATTVAQQQQPRSVIEVPMHRRAKRSKTAEDFLAKAQHLKNKYGYGDAATNKRLARQRRAGSVSMTSYQDSEYFGTISIGTPPVKYSVILDTGSADLIMAAKDCSGCSSTTNGYSTSESSSALTSSTTFSIQYGSGSASGTLVKDNVSIAGYEVTSQTFASCSVLNNIVAGNISGLLGLGWQGLATSGATPLVQALAEGGALPAEVFAFDFKSYAYDELTSDYMAGGKLTIGGTDTSAYSGDINWIDIDSSKTYWSIPLQGITVGGTDVGVTASSVVIDSGTTLIGAPQAAVQAIYAQIGGAQAVTLSGQSGYYSIPCSSSVNVSFTFGNVSYAIPSDSFNAGAFDSRGTVCLGAIFVLSASSSTPTVSNALSWIIGDAFLTGVYSAFRFSSPAAVGFATLGSGGTAVGGSNSSSTSSSGSTNSLNTSASSRSVGLAGPPIALALGALGLVLFA